MLRLPRPYVFGVLGFAFAHGGLRDFHMPSRRFDRILTGTALALVLGLAAAANPAPAMAAKSRGSVLIEATIGVDGKVHNARVINSVAVFDQAALDAVRQWEFEPSRVNGVAVAVTMVIVVTFALL